MNENKKSAELEREEKVRFELHRPDPHNKFYKKVIYNNSLILDNKNKTNDTLSLNPPISRKTVNNIIPSTSHTSDNNQSNGDIDSKRTSFDEFVRYLFT